MINFIPSYVSVKLCHCEKRSNRELCIATFLRAIASFLAMTLCLFSIFAIDCISNIFIDICGYTIITTVGNRHKLL